MTDQEAMALAQAGHQEGFTELYERHKNRVYALCFRMVRNREDAEDLCQETFAKAFRKLESFRRDAAFSTWLYRIAVNMVLMHLRKAAIETVSLETKFEVEMKEGQCDNWLAHDDQQLRTVIERIGLSRAAAALPRGYRTIFLLHDVEGYAHREIARMLGCSIGTSKSQLSKARHSLQSQRLTPTIGASKSNLRRARMMLRENL